MASGRLAEGSGLLGVARRGISAPLAAPPPPHSVVSSECYWGKKRRRREQLLHFSPSLLSISTLFSAALRTSGLFVGNSVDLCGLCRSYGTRCAAGKEGGFKSHRPLFFSSPRSITRYSDSHRYIPIPISLAGSFHTDCGLLRTASTIRVASWRKWSLLWRKSAVLLGGSSRPSLMTWR